MFAVLLNVDLQYWLEFLEERCERLMTGNHQKSANNAPRTGIDDRLS
jgi:hypothetical protein